MSKLFKICFMIWCVLYTPNLVAQILIAHPQTPTTELTRNSARAIFAMRTPHWSDGSPIHVFVLTDDHPVHASFCKHVLGMFPYQLRRIWDRQVYSGTGIAPIIVNSQQEMLSRVAHTKGAVGYIDRDQLNDLVIHIGKEL